ncbi:hypothetical protein KO481_35480 [Nocardia sp. NEAU-G5]|uniref:Uncharacterized protein n=1 Tax=Nocardia albiluteola TaxID=2842303 RepID=A0ABS6BC72_9NOCA|nr:hypothetical protein [Nocardia albiluteola]MBU3066808.1 hypothetical protein [Nocardia albiluteola]
MSGLFGMSWGTIASMAVTGIIAVSTDGIGLAFAPAIGGLVGGAVDGATTGNWMNGIKSGLINTGAGYLGEGAGALIARGVGRVADGLASNLGQRLGTLAYTVGGLGERGGMQAAAKVGGVIAEGISNHETQKIGPLPIIDIGNGKVKATMI